MIAWKRRQSRRLELMVSSLWLIEKLEHREKLEQRPINFIPAFLHMDLPIRLFQEAKFRCSEI